MKIRDTKRAFRKMEQGRLLTRKEQVLVLKWRSRVLRQALLWVERIPDALSGFVESVNRMLQAFAVSLADIGRRMQESSD